MKNIFCKQWKGISFCLPALRAVRRKFIPFRLLGSSPIPRQSADAPLTEHHKICGGYAALEWKKSSFLFGKETHRKADRIRPFLLQQCDKSILLLATNGYQEEMPLKYITVSKCPESRFKLLFLFLLKCGGSNGIYRFRNHPIEA